MSNWVGILFPNNEKARQVGARIKEGLTNLGYEVAERYAEDVSEQAQYLNDLSAGVCDLLIFWALPDSNPEESLQEDTFEYGVIAFEEPIYHAGAVKYYVGFDFYEAGVRQAEYILNNVEDADNFAFCSFTVQSGNVKTEELFTGLKETFENNGFSLDESAVESIAGGEKSGAQARMSMLLSESGNTYDVIWCCTDDIAEGVVEAYTEEEISVADMPIITSFGGSSEMLGYIAAGLQAITVMPDYDMATDRAVEVADRLLNEEDIEDLTEDYIYVESEGSIPFAKIGMSEEIGEEQPEPQEKELESITIDALPDRMIYSEGERFDKSGMVVTAHYSDGISQTVLNYVVSPSSDMPLLETKNITVSYTEHLITKTASFEVTVQAKTSANAKINQSKLRYESSAGEGYVNVATGEAEFLTGIDGIGAEDYRIEFSHIYRGQGFGLPESMQTYVGNSGKLNLQQYLFRDENRYIYIDEEGERHIFEWLESEKYYDTSGLGLILTLDTEENVISDQFGNKMYFANEKLIRTVSCHSAAAGMNYAYYTNGKLESVWERGNIGSKLRFIYNDSTGLLSEIRCQQNDVTKKTFHFYYDTIGNLIRISRSVGTEIREVAMFKYGTSDADVRKLFYAVNSENQSAIRFEYETGAQGRVSKVSVGRVSKDFAPDSVTVDFTKKSENSFVYGTQSGKHYYTSVTNEKGIKAVYYLNAEGITTSILEANAGDMNDLRSMEKRAGLSVMENDDGSSSEKINCCNVKVLNEGEKWVRNVSEDSPIDRYRRNKYHACIYFSFSFWLKITGQVFGEPKVTFTVYSTEDAGNGHYVDTGNAYYDDTAEDAWQLITIPVKISEQHVNKIELTVGGTQEWRVSDIKFIVDQSVQFYIRSDDDSAPLEEFTEIRFYDLSTGRNQVKKLDDRYYMSEKDLQATYCSMVTSQTREFILSLCDNTEKYWVRSVNLYHPEKEKEFSLDLPLNGLARFYQQMKSSDDKTKITGNVYFGHDEQGNIYEGICQRTLAEGKNENENNISSSSCTYVDYKGLMRKERDEYGVETVYEYDSRGRLTRKTLRSDETDETLVFTATQTPTSLTEKDPVIENRTTFDGLFGKPGNTQYKGKDATGNILTTTYTYDEFNERLTDVRNDVVTADAAGNRIVNGNTLTYDESGRLKKVMTSGYGYAFEYDDWGNLSKTSLVDEDGNEQLLTKVNAYYPSSFESSMSVREEKYRSNREDAMWTLLDDYGRPLTIFELNKSFGYEQTSFVRQTLSESAGAAEVTEMYDPYEDRTYVYSYDDANNCTGYTVKTGTDGANFFSVKKTGENTIDYGFGQTDFQSSSVITYDNNAFLDPRITQNALKSESWPVRAGNLSYHYDKLGRIEDKVFTLEESSIEGDVTESTAYVYGTLLKHTVTTKLDGGLSNIHKYSYEYNQRGLPSEVVYEFSDDEEEPLEEISTESYLYDKADRLTTETHRSGSNVKSISYIYNADGSLQKEMSGSFIHRQYVYDKGRLTSYLDKDGNPLATFSYDNLGNCTGYETDEKEVSMEWERGSLLTKYERTETAKSTETTYCYNSRKVRYKKIVDGIEKQYYHDGEKLEAEYWPGNPNGEDSESRRAYLIRYLYDSEGITGIAVLYEQGTGGNKVYYFAKDGQGNVTALITNIATVARYEYDAWGKCKVLDWDGTENTDENFIGNINPIRWKSQYYDRESGMYYIGGRYYDPDIKRYISAVNPEEMLNRAGTVYGINPYLLTLTNPVSMVYNGYTIEPDGELSYEPDELDNFNYFWRYTWNKFWNSKLGKYIAVRLFLVATALAIACPAFLPTYISAVVGIGVSLGVGAIIAGIRSRKQGNGFWSGFATYISENWEQEVAIGMAVALITFGISQAVQAMKRMGPHCFAAGTLVACRNADGEEIHKPIEEIEVGDEVLSYDEETGEQGYKPVVRLFRNQTKEWCHVFVDGEEIECTGGHPFYVEGKGFIPAKELKSGDKCLLSTGGDVTIEKVEVETLTEAETTYNFEVADFHTYYVTEKDILVHNDCAAGQKLPDEGLANSTALRYDTKGHLYSAKTYGADGRVIARIDFQGTPHPVRDLPGNPRIIPHVHPIVYDLGKYYRELPAVSLQYYIGSLL